MTLPLIAILGARGQQGKSVLSYLSQHHSAKYAIRGIVRKPAEQAAIDGVEYVHGDYTEPDSLLKAFDGATAVFAMTNPDMLFTGLEETWGRNIADAVKQSPTVKTLIYSSVADAAKISGNTLTCSNFTGKAATQRYMEEIGVPAVFVWPAFFMQNLTGASPTAPQVDESGTTVFETLVRDDVLVPFVDIDDMGPMVHAILQDQATYLGKSVQLAGEWMTYPELAKRWTATTGKPSRSQHISYVDFAQRFGPAPSLVAEMLVDMYKFVNQFGYYGGRRDSAVIKTTSWEAFVQQNWPASGASTEETQTPAQRALATYFNIFNAANDAASASQPWDLFTPNGVVEFPYAPGGLVRLSGVAAIKRHYEHWPSIFEFHEWSPLKTYAMGENGAIARINCKGRIKTTDKPYTQSYLGVAHVDDSGKVVLYQEYWNPLELSAMIADENV